ncbi:S-adenosyl-L-methionine-dependent methyltransferase [Gigaspora margarita]|uniref:S-adenosyl-L-methionine-dependent methyltransferase n=1 Tax=Gigaspora margarita TaxID=4874 RepID=A0A8H4A5J0_GIGMA|nr:S-adenosyl-L-methionine-dependent methyltransferase [Gigaspora margarita]
MMSNKDNIPKQKVLTIDDDNDFETFLQLNTHRILNGRKFLNDNETKYILPSDKKEINREAMSYSIRQHLFQKHFFSPVEEKLKMRANVLDIGCGAGFWVVDVGLDYPSSSFIGIDIDSTRFPSNDRHPPNVGFLECNITHGIPFPPETFDFVHMSMLCCALTESQWHQLVKEIVRVLKFEGWVEFVEGDPWFKNCGKLGKFMIENTLEVSKKKGINLNIHTMIPKFIGSMNELRDLEYFNVEYPLGEWGGCLGKYVIANIRKAAEGIVYLQKHLGLSTKEYDALLTKHLKELNENKAIGFYHRYYARKTHNS